MKVNGIVSLGKLFLKCLGNMLLCLLCTRSVVLNCSVYQTHPEGLYKHLFLPHYGVSDSVGLGWAQALVFLTIS